MKKICLILAVCMILGCMSGCGGNTRDAESTAADTVATQAPTETQETTVPPSTQATEEVEPTEPNIIGYELEVPAGFEITTSENDRTIYLSEDNLDNSSILIRIQPLDESVLTLDEQGFEEMQVLDQEYEELTVQTVRVDSEAALFADYVVLRDEQRIHIYEYIVVGNEENYVFQFSDYTEEEIWLEAFKEAAESINLLMENEGIELDYSHLERYSLPCGLSLFAAPGMEPQNAPGFSGCIGNREAIILVMKDNKEENNLTGMSLADYAALVSKVNELESFNQDNYGNLHVTFYNSDSNGLRYFNNLTVKETQDSFWVIQMTCTSDNQASYDREFALWATSVAAD